LSVRSKLECRVTYGPPPVHFLPFIVACSAWKRYRPPSTWQSRSARRPQCASGRKSAARTVAVDHPAMNVGLSSATNLRARSTSEGFGAGRVSTGIDPDSQCVGKSRPDRGRRSHSPSLRFVRPWSHKPIATGTAVGPSSPVTKRPVVSSGGSRKPLLTHPVARGKADPSHVLTSSPAVESSRSGFRTPKVAGISA
jgi:hypothetical protein